MDRETDVLVVGSGIAGLTFALEVAREHRVLLVTKKERAESSTNWARGGIAAVLGEDDDPSLHIADTLEAGAGLCHPDAVELLVREGPGRVRELVARGARFARHEGRLSLGKEGGHSRRRIVHAGDRTGREIERTLLKAVEENPRILVFEDHLAVDLLLHGDPPACAGALVLDRTTHEMERVVARITFLATGGWGQVYRHTTNPLIATGDGLAMAFRAGARVANLEFTQFHPTSLYGSGDPAFLLTEAIRGEGAVLRRRDGVEFMAQAHPQGSLAPRDIVARAIDRECRETGDPFVLLDLSPVAPEAAQRHFPDALRECAARGIDPFDGIPVVPAAHYGCGGILTDRHGRTSLPGLLAAGEVACTGVHGANRLASNSLLEALVFAHRAAEITDVEMARLPGPEEGATPAVPVPGGGGLDPRASLPTPGGESTAPLSGGSSPLLEARREALRETVWRVAGIVRTDQLLEEGVEAVAAFHTEAGRLLAAAPSADAHEFRNLVTVAELIVRSAVLRKESRGLHYNVDHPLRDDRRFGTDTVLEAPSPGAARNVGAPHTGTGAAP
jgi:L-aspartate oxidase